MAKYEVNKTIEAARLNKRTGIPLAEPPITLPYGAILDNLEEAGNFIKFTYLTERYQIKADQMNALHPIGGAAGTSSAPNGLKEEAPAVQDARPVLSFENLRVTGSAGLARARVPGGWLVTSSGGVTFVPDEYHAWDGGSHA